MPSAPRGSGTATTLAAVNDKLAALVSALDASQASLGKQGELIAFLENEVSRLRAELAACEEQNR